MGLERGVSRGGHRGAPGGHRVWGLHLAWAGLGLALEPAGFKATWPSQVQQDRVEAEADPE